MKTILIALALIGFTTAGSYAQNSKSCTCKKTVAYHKLAATHHHHKTYAKSVAASPRPITCETVTLSPEACTVYRKDNIVVMECPGIFYGKDNKGVLEYSEDGTYLGYYPLGVNAPAVNNNSNNNDDGANDNTNLIAPQHTVIDNYRGVAPAGGNYCIKCSAQ